MGYRLTASAGGGKVGRIVASAAAKHLTPTTLEVSAGVLLVKISRANPLTHSSEVV